MGHNYSTRWLRVVYAEKHLSWNGPEHRSVPDSPHSETTARDPVSRGSIYNGCTALRRQLTLLIESHFVVVLRAPSHLLMLAVRVGSYTGGGWVMGSDGRLRFSAELFAILDRYELSFWILLEGAPGELPLLPGVLFEIRARNGYGLETLREFILGRASSRLPYMVVMQSHRELLQQQWNRSSDVGQ